MYNICKYYAPSIGVPKYVKEILTGLKGEIDSNTIIEGDFSIPLSTIDILSREKN